MGHEKSLLSALNRDFWSYASLILDPASKRALEDACRKAGAPAPGRLTPAGATGLALERRVLAVAHGEPGGAFVRHAGFFCGSSAARLFEANVRSPNEGAKRLANAIAAECSSLVLEGKAKSESQFELAIISLAALERSLKEFAGGFVKGAAVRLNEGDVPLIRERVTAGGKVWRATVEW